MNSKLTYFHNNLCGSQLSSVLTMSLSFTELHKVEVPTTDFALLRGEHSCSAAVRKNCMEIKLVEGMFTSVCCEHHDSISYHFDVSCLTWRAKSWRSYS